MNGRTLTTLVAVLVAGGLQAAGCSTGGGSGGGGSAAAGVTPGNVTSGSLVEGLPTPQYDATGYRMSTAQVNAVPGGRVPALAAAPINTAVYAANFPGGSVMIVDDQQVTLSGNLFYEAQSMAVDGTRVFAATANPTRAGAGDLYANTGTGWSNVVDSPDAEMVVGNALGGIYAAHGGRSAGGSLLRYESGSNTFSTVASLQSAIPTAIVESDGALYVGGSDSFASHARLLRLDAGSLVDVPVPGAGGGFGMRQEITSMISVATVASGSTAPIVTEVLILAIGTFDAVGGAVGGQVFASDGATRFELLASYAGDAPIAVVLQDGGLVIATSNGKLQRREATGVLVDEVVPAEVRGFDSAISRNATSMVLGARSATGALLVRRIGGGFVAAGRDRFYNPDLKAVLQNRCASCHTPGSPVPAATAAMSLTLSATSNTADHTTVTARVNLAAPSTSPLLQKAVGGLSHFGGQVIAVGSADYNVMLDWVTQGARLEASTPPPSNMKTYVNDIRPLLNACTSCHNGGGGNFLLSNNLSLNQADHAEVLQEINMGTPEASDILRKPTRQVTHGGGERFTTQSQEYMIILQWIQQGARFQ